MNPEKIFKKVTGEDPKKLYLRMMLKVLHPHGIPFFRRLWTTPEQRTAYDNRGKHHEPEKPVEEAPLGSA